MEACRVQGCCTGLEQSTGFRCGWKARDGRERRCIAVSASLRFNPRRLGVPLSRDLKQSTGSAEAGQLATVGNADMREWEHG
jgi:hypothetical protein